MTSVPSSALFCNPISASMLLDSLISFLTSLEHYDCKALYLHVLTSNMTAIRFYERRNFHRHNYLPYYYSIQGQPCDGFCYVLYINGGQPPWTLLYPLSLLVILINYAEMQGSLSQFALPTKSSCWYRSDSAQLWGGFFLWKGRAHLLHFLPWPPCTDYVKHVGGFLMKLQPCAIPQRLVASLRGLWNRATGLPPIVHQIHNS